MKQIILSDDICMYGDAKWVKTLEKKHFLKTLSTENFIDAVLTWWPNFIYFWMWVNFLWGSSQTLK